MNYKYSDYKHSQNFLKLEYKPLLKYLPLSTNYIIYKLILSLLVANLTDISYVYYSIKIKTKFFLFVIPGFLMLAQSVTSLLLLFLVAPYEFGTLSFEITTLIKIFIFIFCWLIWWSLNILWVKLCFKSIKKSCYKKFSNIEKSGDLYEINKITNFNEWVKKYIFSNSIPNTLNLASDNFEPLIKNPITFNVKGRLLLTEQSAKTKYLDLYSNDAFVLLQPLKNIFFIVPWLLYLESIHRYYKKEINLSIRKFVYFSYLSFFTLILITFVLIYLAIISNSTYLWVALGCLTFYLVCFVPLKSLFIRMYLRNEFSLKNEMPTEKNQKSFFKNISYNNLPINYYELKPIEQERQFIKVFKVFSIIGIFNFYLLVILDLIFIILFYTISYSLDFIIIFSVLIVFTYFLYNCVSYLWIKEISKNNIHNIEKLKTYNWLLFIPTIIFWIKKRHIFK